MKDWSLRNLGACAALGSGRARRVLGALSNKPAKDSSTVIVLIESGLLFCQAAEPLATRLAIADIALGLVNHSQVGAWVRKTLVTTSTDGSTGCCRGGQRPWATNANALFPSMPPVT